ncbi:hypothetical protein BH10ACT2_BH10ACT2_18730 [soil metagenome]
MESIRAALPGDYARLARIAAEGDSEDCDAHYLSFVADSGRLLCSIVNDEVVAFAGTVPVDGVAMVTDRFVAKTSRGYGIGGQLLRELLQQHPRRMTFSARNVGALSSYRRMGMQPRGRMLYLSGSGLAGRSSGPPLQPSAWVHGRSDLVGHYSARGAIVTSNAVALVSAGGVDVLRLEASDAIAACDLLLRAFDSGTNVRLYVPEQHRLAGWLLANSFAVVDHDVLCATDGADLPPALAALHPGLA